MNTVNLTDLFGFNIKNSIKNINKDYIIIEIPHDLYNHCLNAIGQYNGNIIYSLNLNSNLLQNVFSKHNLNINDYVSMGNYISHNQQTLKIIVSNKQNTYHTNKYNLIDIVNDLYIWKPLSNSDSNTNLGVVCTRNDSIPDVETGLISKNNCNVFEINNSLAELFIGDYALLNCIKDGKRKIITTNLLKNKNTNVNVNVNVNVNNKVEHFVNHYDKNQTEAFDNAHINDGDDWIQYRGKQVVLVAENNPWYINKNTTIPSKYISNDNFLGANLFKNNYASYESKVELDIDSPSLGYGYSYASRQNVEKFNGTYDEITDNNSDIIVFILFFILLLLFVYNIYYKKNKS